MFGDGNGRGGESGLIDTLYGFCVGFGVQQIERLRNRERKRKRRERRARELDGVG